VGTLAGGRLIGWGPADLFPRRRVSSQKCSPAEGAPQKWSYWPDPSGLPFMTIALLIALAASLALMAVIVKRLDSQT
jgi:TRAP-type C4-dicarboxylate transport system permease small subunit